MKRAEQILQQSVFSTIKPLMALQGYKQFMAFQIRNETGVKGSKGEILGMIAKSMGTMAGVSDTVFLFPGGKTIFVEFKAMKPLKTRERQPEELLNDDQRLFKDRIERFGFEYKIVAAENEYEALDLVFKILRDNGVKV